MFVRRGLRLTLHRERRGRSIALIATETGRRRTFPFTSAVRLGRFQSDMEDFLCRTGWSLTDTPDTVDTPSVPPLEVNDDSGLRLTLAEEESNFQLTTLNSQGH